MDRPSETVDAPSEAVDAEAPSALAVTRADGRTGYRKGAETRERLISSAQDAIHELGFNRASSREVARRSGVTFGVIQHHFGTYEAVLLAAVQREGMYLQTLLASAEITGTTTEERLESVVELVWGYVSRPENLVYMEIHTNLMRDPSTSEEALRLLREGRAQIEELWLDVMRKAFDQQEEDPVLRRILFATMRGLAISVWMSQGELDYIEERRIFVEAIAPFFERAATRSGVGAGPGE